ncbi:hypothetical protein EJB05_30010, partial [Eragrostis curvula]
MRRRYGLPANRSVCGGRPAMADYGKWLLCAPCALAQEVCRTANLYGGEQVSVSVSRGNAGNGAPADGRVRRAIDGRQGFCNASHMMLRVANFTKSYTDKSQELNIVLGQIIMFILLLLFMILSFDFRATLLTPKFRLVLSSALALFLPVMSYLFSSAKDAAVAVARSRGDTKIIDDSLLVRTWIILENMLFVELLRKKVDVIRMRGYSEIIQRAGRFVWLGSLIFFNVKNIGARTWAIGLWIFCSCQLVHKIAVAEVLKRSHPDQSWLISSYMAQILPQAHVVDEEEPLGEELLKRCQYIVMGEEKLVGKVTADGYMLNNLNTDADPGIITVGKVWQLAEVDTGIKRLCLSFALFKLLRRKLELLPVMPTKEEAMDCRDLFKKGLLYGTGSESSGVQLFQVMVDEVSFLSEYYHYVVPVVLASPSFVLLNYFLQPAAVLTFGFLLVAFLLYGHGDVIYAWRRLISETDPLGPKLFICTLVTATHSRPALFSMIDTLIYILLACIAGFEFFGEYLVVKSSNWFMVSKICNNMAELGGRPAFSNRRRSNTIIKLKQFNLLDHRGPPVLPMVPSVGSLKLTSVPMTDDVKQSMMELHVQQLAGPPDDDDDDDDDAVAALTNGTSALRRNNLFDQLQWACDRDNSVTEVILTWHIATCLLESKLPALSVRKEEAKVAMGLSKYCAYLVVFHPELLPDRVAKAELVVEDARKEMRAMLGFWGYYFSFRRARAIKMLLQTAGSKDNSRVVQHSAKLAMQLITAARRDGRQFVWKVLAEVWTELVVYVAPSSDEAHVKGHADMLPEGVELITVLWAFAMHTGISRPPTQEEDGRV